MAIEEKLDSLERLFTGEDDSLKKLNALFAYTEDDDFLVKHKSYYLLKQLKEQRAVPLILKKLKNKFLPEEECLRLIDICTELKKDTPIALKSLLYSKNPYLIRGELTALAKNGGIKSLELIMKFATSGKGGIIRRELYSELLGFLLDKEPVLIAYLDKMVIENKMMRGFLRDMEIAGPKYKRLSVYPANDYWAGKARCNGYGYGYFKYRIESIIIKKNQLNYLDIADNMR